MAGKVGTGCAACKHAPRGIEDFIRGRDMSEICPDAYKEVSQYCNNYCDAKKGVAKSREDNANL